MRRSARITLFQASHLLALALVALLLRGAAADPTAEALYERGILIRDVETAEGTISFELVNENVGPVTESLARASVARWVAVPPGASVSFEMTEAEWSVQWLATGETEGPFALDDTSPAGRLPLAIRNVSGEFAGTFRSVGLARCRIGLSSTVSAASGPSRQGVAVLHRARIVGTIRALQPDSEVAPADLAARDPYLVDFLGNLVLNPGQLQEVTREVEGLENVEALRAWEGLLKKASEPGGLLYKARVAHPGIYAISARDLLSKGLEATAVNPDRLQVFVGDREVPLFRPRDRRGALAADELVYFHIPNEFPARIPYIPVWLIQTSDETAPARGWPRDTVTRGSLVRDPGIELRSKLEIFEPKVYDVRVADTVRTGKWASNQMAVGQFARMPFTLESVDTTSSATLRVEFGGSSSALRRHAAVYLNGDQLGDRDLLVGIGPHLQSYTVPAGLLREGRNELTVHYPESREERMDPMLVTYWAELDYPVDPSMFPLNREVEVSGPAGSRVDVRRPSVGGDYRMGRFFVDVTEPFAPKSLETFSAATSAGPAYGARIELGDGTRRFRYVDEMTVRYLPRLFEARPVDLIEPAEGADYIVIAHHLLLPALHDLVRSRETEGRRVRLIDVEDIYNVFSFGAKDDRPIHDFLIHAFAAWPGRRMSQVLLVGEASEYWWEERHPSPRVAPNLLPIYGYGNADVRIRTDDNYAHLTGRDPIADIEIGRLSARTFAEVEGIARRIFEYETSPPADPGVVRHLFITDDETEFARVADRIITTQLDRSGEPRRLYLQHHPYEDYFRIYARKRSKAMTRAIIEEMSRGALTATYYGHGGPNLWAEERIFHYRDIPEIKLEGLRPIMAAASCDTAWVDYPVEPVSRSIGEQFLLAENGGGIALYAPVAGTNSYEHDFLLRPFYESLITHRTRELGRVTLYSKIQYMLYRNQRAVPNQFILLGDPALRIPRASSNLTARIEPAEIFSTQGAELRIEGGSPTFAWGQSELHVLDSNGVRVAGPVRAPVRAGRFELSAKLPPVLVPGNYRLLLTAWNRGEGRVASVDVPFEVLQPQVELEWTMTPGPETAIAAGQNVAMRLRARNASEGFMEDLVLRLRDAAQGQTLRESQVSLSPGEERVVQFAFPAPPGINRLEAEVTYREHPSGHEPLARAHVEFIAADASLPYVAISPHLARVERTASPEQTSFTIPIFGVRGSELQEVEATLFLLDNPEGTPVGTVVTNLGIAAGGHAEARFTAASLFPEQTMPFRLVVRGFAPETGERFEQRLETTIAIPGGNDVIVVPGSTRTERESYVRGHTVYVRATVRNVGREPVHNLRTTLYVDFPWDPNSQATANVDESSVVFDRPLMPGEARDVRLRWDPDVRSNMSARLYVVANSDRRTPEATYLNNVGDVPVSLLRLPNLSLDAALLTARPRNVRPGEVVALTVPYYNRSPFDFAHPFVLHVEARGPGVDPELVYRGSFERLAAGEEGLVQLAWRADGVRDHIHISLNDDRDYGEQEIDDNIAVVRLQHVVNERFLRRTDGAWDLASTFGWGRISSLAVMPDGALALREFPQEEVVLKFHNAHVVGEPLPEGFLHHEADNLMAIHEGGLHWTVQETPQEARFRLPLPKDDGTTLYDIYFNQISPSAALTAAPVNRFNYMIEDDENWQPMERHTVPRAYVGRYDSRDNYLDIAFAPRSIPSNNSIFSIAAIPIAGTFESPLYEVDGLRAGRFLAEFDAPGSSRVEFALRLGGGTADEPDFSQWYPIRPGDRFAADMETRFMQVRARLLGDGTGLPVLRNVRFVFGSDTESAEARQ
ncbi:MAG: hypothetical protein KF858_03650 [Candidatus Sumerlaeia bacterium]|nr:hypothetical protein [Candidatus Sumerlaeia bacterium]